MLESEIQAALDEINKAKERLQNIEQRSAAALGGSAARSRTDAQIARTNLTEAVKLLEKARKSQNGNGKK